MLWDVFKLNICLQITIKYTILFNPIVVMFHAAFPPLYLTESCPLSAPPNGGTIPPTSLKIELDTLPSLFCSLDILTQKVWHSKINFWQNSDLSKSFYAFQHVDQFKTKTSLESKVFIFNRLYFLSPVKVSKPKARKKKFGQKKGMGPKKCRSKKKEELWVQNFGAKIDFG